MLLKLLLLESPTGAPIRMSDLDRLVLLRTKFPAAAASVIRDLRKHYDTVPAASAFLDRGCGSFPWGALTDLVVPPPGCTMNILSIENFLCEFHRLIDRSNRPKSIRYFKRSHLTGPPLEFATAVFDQPDGQSAISRPATRDGGEDSTHCCVL